MIWTDESTGTDEGERRVSDERAMRTAVDGQPTDSSSERAGTEVGTTICWLACDPRIIGPADMRAHAIVAHPSPCHAPGPGCCWLRSGCCRRIRLALLSSARLTSGTVAWNAMAREERRGEEGGRAGSPETPMHTRVGVVTAGGSGRSSENSSETRVLDRGKGWSTGRRDLVTDIKNASNWLYYLVTFN